MTTEYLKEKENLLAGIREIDEKLLNSNENLNVAGHRIEGLTLKLNTELEKSALFQDQNRALLNEIE